MGFEVKTVDAIINSELWVKKLPNNEIDIMRTKKRFRHKTTWTDKNILLIAMALLCLQI